MADARKTDRRTVYTKKAIGDALLRVKRNKDYNTITVADICREAEISRGTFYAHFSNISEVLDALLDDAFANMDYLRNYMAAPDAGTGPQCAYPFCRFVRESKELRCILFDDALGHIVIKKLAELYKDDFILEIQRIAGSLSAREAEALFYFQINGCFAVSKKYSNLENGEWCPVQNMIDRFIKGGISSFPKQMARSQEEYF